MNAVLKFIMVVLVITFIFSYGLLLHASFSDERTRLLTETVQEQFFEIEELKANLSVCNWELGNTQSIELNALVTKEMMRVKSSPVAEDKEENAKKGD